MAEFQFLAPKPLTGADLPPEWESFKEDFNQFLIAIEKDGADDKVKLALLLRTIGERGKDIYKGLVFPTGKSKDKYNDVIAQMDAFCKPRLNLFNTRDYFLTCRQNGGTVDEYLTELRKRGRNCDFGDQLDTLILHTLVLGLDDTNLKEKIKQMENVTLENVVTVLRRYEEAKKTSNPTSEATVSAISRRPQQYSKSSCTRCGGSPHSLDYCPAKGETCSKCKKLNHFARCCRTSDANDRSQCSLFIGSIICHDDEQHSWSINVSINNQSTKVIMDTGAECNTLPADLVSKLDLELSPCETKLISYSGHQLIPAGKAYANVEDAHGDKAQLEFYIVPRGFKAVIGGNDCLRLGLITRTDNTSEPNSEASVPTPAQAKLNQQVSYDDSANCPPKPRPILQYVQDLPKHDQRQYQADLTADISNRVAYRRNRRQIRKDADQTVAPLADMTIQTAPDINIV